MGGRLKAEAEKVELCQVWEEGRVESESIGGGDQSFLGREEKKSRHLAKVNDWVMFLERRERNNYVINGSWAGLDSSWQTK